MEGGINLPVAEDDIEEVSLEDSELKCSGGEPETLLDDKILDKEE